MLGQTSYLFFIKALENRDKVNINSPCYLILTIQKSN